MSSVRKIVRDEIIAAVKALLPALASTVSAWNGEPEAFNTDADFPSIQVRYLGAGFGGDEEPGAAATTYERALYYGVYVSARGADGEDDALEYLETLEEGLAGLETSWGIIELADKEESINVAMGRYLYRQFYKATAMVSK